MDIYVQKDGQRQGPYSEAQIRTGIDRGDLKPNDAAWMTGEASWQALSALINLDVNKTPPLDHQPNSSPAAVVSKTVSAMPLKPTKGDKIRASIAVLTIGFVCCLFLGFIMKDCSSDHIDEKTWAALNERQGFGKDQTDPQSHAAIIHGNEEAFIAKYGKPSKVTHGAQPPATDDLLFRKGDLVYEVSFWYGSASNVLIWRWDDHALTDQDIQIGLNAFSDGEEWVHQDKADTKGKEIWKRIGVAAFIEDVRSKAPNPTEYIPVNDLHIATEEFINKYNESNTPAP